MSAAGCSWPALGTTATVQVTDALRMSVSRAAVERELAAIDEACSRFRDDSELSRLNRHPGRWVDASPLFLDAIEAGLRAARVTDGDVSPTIGAAIRVAGYDRDFTELEGHRLPDRVASGSPAAGDSEGPASGAAEAPVSGGPVITFERAPGWRSVEVDRLHGRVRLARRVELDLGATAKALASDRAALAASRAAGAGVLVSLGGDIAVAGPAPSAGWAVGIADNHSASPSTRLPTVSITRGGLATSSTAVRRWRHGGQEMHHIIDPSSGRPAEVVWRTVTVAAANCVDANTASTAAIIRGQAAPAWLEGLGLPARLVGADGRVVAVGGWPEES